MYERFTSRARKCMQLANQEAQRFNHEYIGTEHILLGLISRKGDIGCGMTVIVNLHVSLVSICLEVEKLMQSGPDTVVVGKLPFTPGHKRVIEYSMEEARNLNHNYVGTEHILLGLLREHEGIAAQVLRNLGLTLHKVYEEVVRLLGEQEEPVAKPEWKWQPQGDGALLRLMHGSRVVLVIDRMRVLVKDAGRVTNEPVSFGRGEWPSWEDRQHVLTMLNDPGAAREEVVRLTGEKEASCSELDVCSMCGVVFE
ncbi:hypothetical protein LCGC14_2578490, partial [marine sediment metagenome]